MPRYHIVVYLVPDPNDEIQIPFIDEELDSQLGMNDIQEDVDNIMEAWKANKSSSYSP